MSVDKLQRSGGSGRKLRRSRDQAMVGGVCAGLAEHLGTDPLLVRLIFTVSILLGFGAPLLVYLLLWLLLGRG